jgi:hypothetical protein
MLLDQLTTMPTREVVRVKKEVLPWVKIKPSSNPQKPQVQLSSTSVELVQSENDYILFRELNGSLYIVTPSPFSIKSDASKQTDTRIGVTNRLEITKACIETWTTDLSQFHGEYLLELQASEERATTSGENILIKTFKLVATNGNSNQQSTETSEDVTDGLSHDESEDNGNESGVLDSEFSDGRDNGVDFLLSEDSVF